MNDRIQIMHALLRDQLQKSHQLYEKQYNLRSKPVRFTIGQEVFKRNFVLSDKAKNINAKFCKKFIKCRVRTVMGHNRYELENIMGTKSLGIFHAKDIRAWVLGVVADAPHWTINMRRFPLFSSLLKILLTKVVCSDSIFIRQKIYHQRKEKKKEEKHRLTTKLWK